MHVRPARLLPTVLAVGSALNPEPGHQQQHIGEQLGLGGDAGPNLVFGTTAGNAYGGGIYTKGRVTAVNCTFATNITKGGGTINLNWILSSGGSAYGGGLAIAEGASLSLLNVTMAGNTAQPSDPPRGASPFGSSIWVESGSTALTNVVVACAAGQTNAWGILTDGGHNICSDLSAQFSMASSRNNLDPLLGNLGYYGGITPTIALLPASPAVDAATTPTARPQTNAGFPGHKRPRATSGRLKWSRN